MFDKLRLLHRDLCAKLLGKKCTVERTRVNLKEYRQAFGVTYNFLKKKKYKILYRLIEIRGLQKPYAKNNGMLDPVLF